MRCIGWRLRQQPGRHRVSGTREAASGWQGQTTHSCLVPCLDIPRTLLGPQGPLPFQLTERSDESAQAQGRKARRAQASRMIGVYTRANCRRQGGGAEKEARGEGGVGWLHL